MTYDFDALLDRVEKPARYTGGEMNAEVKPISQAEISFAFCFPDTYEVAMSHLGMKILYGILNKLAAEGMELPHVAITGGFATEDQVYKALALGAPYISAVGLCRSSMAAAMSAKKIGDLIEAGKVPPELARFGTTKEELFSDLPELRGLYGSAADGFSTGAVGVYSYLNRIAYGLRHFAALNRKFDVKHIGRRDVFPLTRDAKELLDGTWLR